MLYQTTQLSPDAGIQTALVYRQLRHDMLIRLRWMIVFFQAVAVFFAWFIIAADIPLLACCVLIGLSAIVNLCARWRQQKSTFLESGVAAGFLAYDILQLAAMLYLTGGTSNPLIFLLLAPVLIAATSLRRAHAIVLATLVFIASSIMVEHHLPLPTRSVAGAAPGLPYVIVMWLSLNICLVGMAGYSFLVTSQARNLSAALTATELVLAREQHLSALDGMAAAAAHELGTPLSTIAVIARELAREWPPDTALGADIELLGSQAKRCRDILAKLSSLSSDGGGPMAVVRLTDLIEELAEPHRNFGIAIHVQRHSLVDEGGSSPEIQRLPGVLYGIGNLLENAVDFAKSEVKVTLAWDEDAIIVKIVDDGPGFSDAVAERLGEPYNTSRQNKAAKRDVPIEGGGLGLGIFIGKTLLERSGASLAFENVKAPGSGAEVSIVWSREKIGFRDPRMVASG